MTVRSVARGLPVLGHAAGLVACGAVAQAAAGAGLWATLTGAIVVAMWLLLAGTVALRRQLTVDPVAAEPPEAAADRLLLDVAPVPMLAVEHGSASAINRAARRLFATDDRVLPMPPALADDGASHLRHEARTWRIDRVALPAGRVVVALIDIEQEERAAEARAAAELIQVLGHELLNGLAPIASLAESGATLLDRPDADPALLREILLTLARRAEGLERFAEGYRSLARLPEPMRDTVAVQPLVEDLARLFAGRWPGKALVTQAPRLDWPLDRDQLTQALWALLQNAAEAAQTRVGLTAAPVGDGLAFEVTDDGRGVPVEARARIFRPFHTTRDGGTGIGLSLARQVAQAHGGTLTLLDGTTTTFRLWLPPAR